MIANKNRGDIIKGMAYIMCSSDIDCSDCATFGSCIHIHNANDFYEYFLCREDESLKERTKDLLQRIYDNVDLSYVDKKYLVYLGMEYGVEVDEK